MLSLSTLDFFTGFTPYFFITVYPEREAVSGRDFLPRDREVFHRFRHGKQKLGIVEEEFRCVVYILSDAVEVSLEEEVSCDKHAFSNETLSRRHAARPGLECAVGNVYTFQNRRTPTDTG